MVMAGYQSAGGHNQNKMSPTKSILFGLSAGIIIYAFAANIGGVFSGTGAGDSQSDGVVTGALAPGAKAVSGGAKSFGTKLAQAGTMLAPTVTPLSAAVAPVTPRAITAQTVATSPSMTPALSATPTAVVPHVNTPTPTPSITPSTTPTSTATPSPTTSPTSTPTPVPTPTGTSHVVVNEIAWAGTASGSATNPGTSGSVDEWIELYNSGTGTQELEGWSICGNDLKIVTFSSLHRIEQGQFFLIERTDDTTISDISGDYVGAFAKTLVDSGLRLTLRSGTCLDGAVVDQVGPGTWYAGSSSGKATMERISAAASGNDSANWNTWGTIPDAQGNTVSTGLDAGGNPIHGTPKFKNSVSP